MEAKMPDGSRLREFFSSDERLKERIKEIENAGGRVERVVHAHEGSKYGPHQSTKETERRRKQLQKLNEAMTDELRRVSGKG